MSNAAENIAFLYLLNQDTKSLSLAELCALYADTVKQAKACAEQYKRESSESTFSFD